MNIVQQCVEEVRVSASFTKESIPPLIEYTKVFVINRQHVKHLEPGIIIARDHIHYRIRFDDNKKIWMPAHWIVAIPGEFYDSHPGR